MIQLITTLLLSGSLLISHGLAQNSLDEGLVAYYSFEGGAQDATANNNDAEVRGATLVEGYVGQPESAYRLDGENDYLVVPHSESLSLSDEASFSLWWRHTQQASPDQYYTLLEKSDPERGGHSRYGMWLIGNLVEACVEAPDNSQQSCLDSTEALSEGWHHLAATYDGSSLRVYIEGELSGEREIEPTGISQSAFELFVGTDQYAPEPLYTEGAIDELRIYDRALSQDEIARLAQEQE